LKRLLIRPGAIGDFVVSLPAMECLRADYLEVWAASPNVPLARFAHRARSIASTGLDLLELTEPDPRLLDALRSFDEIVSWYGASRPEFRDRVASLGLPFRFFPALPHESGTTHATDFYLRQVRTITDCVSDGIPRIACPVVVREGAIIHPFSGGRKKCWPLERFQELARRLSLCIPVAWCAGPEDDLPGAVCFDDLYELTCRFAAARVYIGNDSGPTHLAAAAGTPVVALFGPSDPAIWSPRGWQVSLAAASSLEDISIDQVESLVYHVLRGKH
jgi:heptosyltransferase-3